MSLFVLQEMLGPASKQAFSVKKSVSLASSQLLSSVTISERLGSSKLRSPL